jgi:hypothetical protein
MHATVRRFATLSLALAAVAACSPEGTAPTVRMPNAPSLAVVAPTGIAVDAVAGLTVYAHWQDNSATNGGFYLVLSDPTNVQATQKYQIIYGGNTTSGSITAYSQGCYLVSVFAWGTGDTDSVWSTVGPVGVGVDNCQSATLKTNKGKGNR